MGRFGGILTTEEVTYSHVLNDCLNDCRIKGMALAEVEKGFYIGAVRQGSMVSLFESMGFNKENEILPIFLNQYKNNGGWMPLTPFTLLLNDPCDLNDFIDGELTIACFLKIDEFKKMAMAMAMGYEFVFSVDDEYSMLFKGIGEDVIFGVSWQMLLRVPLEMMSLFWLVKESIEKYESALEICSRNKLINEHPTINNAMFEKFRPLFIH